MLVCNNASAVNLDEISEDMLAFIPETSSVLARISASKLDCNKVLASFLKVASLFIALILEASSESILVFKVDSADKALFSSERTAAALAVISLSILDCNPASAVNLDAISEDMLSFIPDTSRVLDNTSASKLDCRVLSFASLVAASLSMLLCKLESALFCLWFHYLNQFLINQ